MVARQGTRGGAVGIPGVGKRQGRRAESHRKHFHTQAAFREGKGTVAQQLLHQAPRPRCPRATAGRWEERAARQKVWQCLGQVEAAWEARATRVSHTLCPIQARLATGGDTHPLGEGASASMSSAGCGRRAQRESVTQRALPLAQRQSRR